MPENDQHSQPDPGFPSPPAEGIRRLAAIMFTDIKGFSTKMQQNEVVTMRMLEVHNRMMHETVRKYRGSVIKTIGDAFLVSFESVVDAVSCAVEAQQQFLEHNKDRSPEERITVRIGVHLGDVIVKEKDVFGDGVNIASRVQSMAEPGGVNITESVYQQVKNKMDIHVVTLGAPQLKGIREAVKVYQVIIVPEARRRGKLATNLYVAKTLLKRKRSRQLIAAAFAMVFVALYVWTTYLATPSIKSIAVLPFDNLLGADQEYLTDGLSEEIISQLTKIPEILVISKASSFGFKGTTLDDREVASQLGVEFLLKGNVRSVAGQVNVDTYLLEPLTGARVWTETYLLNPNELFRLQYDIPSQISRRFRLQLGGRRSTAPPELFDLYFRALYEKRKLTREANLLAIGLYSQAVSQDSMFEPALVGLANAHLLNYDYGWNQSEASLLASEKYCNKALALDSTNADALAMVGRIFVLRGVREKGIRLLQSALQHDPRNYSALTALGREYLFNLNEPATGIAYLNRALETDPANFLLASNIGVGYGMLKNYPEAIGAFRRASILNPSHDFPFSNLGSAFERNRQYDSALFYYRAAAQKNVSREHNYLLWGELLLALKQYARAESVLTAGSRQARETDGVLYDLGVAYSLQGKDVAARRVWEEALQRMRPEVEKDPPSLKHLPPVALLSARLGRERDALSFIQRALLMDSTDSEILFDAARVYGVLGRKKEMLSTFKKARSMNPEYDADYIATALDFEGFRSDTELLAAARQ